MAAVLPKNLALIVQRLANFHRTVIRVRPQSNDQAEAGQTITFRFPANTLIDLHNLQLTGKATITQTGVRKTSPIVLPSSMHGCIERLDVVVNGQVITGSNSDYGCLHWLLFNHVAAEPARALLSPLESGADFSDGVATKSIAGTVDAVAVVNGVSEFPFTIDGFMGFLSGSHVRFIDTAVLGPIEIRIRLAPASILAGIDKTIEAAEVTTITRLNQAATYKWSDMYLMLDTISFTDDFYRAILAKRLLDGGLISIPYQNFFSFQKAITSSGDTHNFNVATQSLDYLISTLRPSAYASSGLKTYDTAGVDNTTFYSCLSGAGTAQFPTTSYQFLVNNMLCPTWPASVNEAQSLTRSALDLANDISGAGRVTTKGKYRNGMFAFIQAFAHHAETDKVISGLDTRGASSNMQFMVNGLTAIVDAELYGAAATTTNYHSMIWAATTSSLEISAGQNAVVIF